MFIPPTFLQTKIVSPFFIIEVSEFRSNLLNAVVLRTIGVKCWSNVNVKSLRVIEVTFHVDGDSIESTRLHPSTKVIFFFFFLDDL